MKDATVSVASSHPVYFFAHLTVQSGCSGHQSFAPSGDLRSKGWRTS